GASWVFVFWGFLHGAYLVVQRLLGPGWGAALKNLRIPKIVQDGLNIAIVFFFTNLAWIFFRSPDFDTALKVIGGIASFENFNWANVTNKFWVIKGLLLISLLLTVEISNFKISYENAVLKSPAFRVVSFAVLLWVIAFFGTFGSNAFIYFQF
ncbi:MAG TPA: hypothetical protein PKC40_10775, partial [Saprospiraceae bacterium]|nr:hypothetical protein [Saprospiraceae bacterium]